MLVASKRSGLARLGLFLLCLGDAAWVPGATGLTVGSVLALGIVSGSLQLNVRGIVLVTILQGIWILLVVAYLLRAQSPSSREEADGRSI